MTASVSPRRHRVRSLLLLTALALAAPAARAASLTTVALLPATGSNVSEGQLAAAGDVLRAHLESTGRFVVVRSGGPTGSAELSGPDAGAAARAAGASLAVAVHVARLGETAVVRVAAYAPDGAVVHADQLGALGVDDLDPALDRLAAGLARGGRAADLAEIDTVTAKEERPLRKMTAWMAYGLKIGSLVPIHRPDPTARAGSAGGVGLVWHYDARSWLADVSLEGFTSNLDAWKPDPDRALAVAIGAYKPFSKGNVAPYLGLGLAYAVTRFADVSGHGIQPRASAGLLLGRLSNVAVRVEAGWFIDAFPVTERGTGRDVWVHGGFGSFAIVSSEPTVR
jgi:hypothetical protein